MRGKDYELPASKDRSIKSSNRLHTHTHTHKKKKARHPRQVVGQTAMVRRFQATQLDVGDTVL